MLVETRDGDAGKSAHVIVVGNEKGGSGKSTIAVHVALALLKAGQRVVTIDLDSRQKTITHFFEDRRAWSERDGIELEIPNHYCVAKADGLRADVNENVECNALIKVVAAVEHAHDFLVIDTPGADGYLMRLAHAMADTLITPLNDSFVDFAVLGIVDPVTYSLIEPGHYTKMVRDARRERHKFDQNATDWIVMRNRLSNLGSSSRQRLVQSLNELGLQLGFRCAEGFVERLIYREFFPRGITALDKISYSRSGSRSIRSHQNARQEIQSLIAALKLPINEKGRLRARARAEWFAGRDRQVELGDCV
jgi:chromosome partitioning protein